MRNVPSLLVGLFALLFYSTIALAQQPPPNNPTPRTVPASQPAAPAAKRESPKAAAKAPQAKSAAQPTSATKREAPKAAPAAKREAPKAVAKTTKKEKNVLVHYFEIFVAKLEGAVFYPIFGFPFVVIVLIFGSVFFTFRMGLINLRGFAHSINIIRGKYDNPDDEGEISHFQALTSALSATVGLGNIAGVAVAVGKGGPGAVFWMILIAFFGMTAKFVECTLAQMYRKVDADGTVHGGPMYYLSEGLSRKGLGGIGAVLSAFFAVCVIGGAFGGGNMFQANQAYELVSGYVPILKQNSWLFGGSLSLLVGLVILGGIKRIGSATAKIVPFMVALYVGASLFIIITNIERVPSMFKMIFNSAFHADAVYGGILGVMVVGICRAVFSNEAGIGSAAIAHSAAKTDEPVREGMVAMIGPFIDTVVICLMTATVILLTAPENKPLQAMRTAQKNAYSAKLEVAKTQGLLAKAKASKNKANIKAAQATLTVQTAHLTKANKAYKKTQAGAKITSAAFGSVFSWFPLVLSLVVFLFAYSTMISWSYYGEQGWGYLFGSNSIFIYRIIFLGFIILGSMAKLNTVLAFSDVMIFLCAFPNILGGLLMSGEVKTQLNDYWGRYQQGSFKTYK